MSCRPEFVTGYVDDALEPVEHARVAAHLETCADCREQAEAERSLRARLRSLTPLEPRPGFESEVRVALRGTRIRRLGRWLLPLAAGLAVLGLWLRGSPEAVARELAFDHLKCFRKDTLPAKVVSNDSAVIVAWFAGQGTTIPRLPSRTAGVEVQGARYCPLLDGTSVAHVYYREGDRHVSLFVVPRGLRMEATLRTTALGRAVHLLDRGDSTLALVGESVADVEAFAAELITRAASALEPREAMTEPEVIATANRRRNGRGKPETFDFLGFTHACEDEKRTLHGAAAELRRAIEHALAGWFALSEAIIRAVAPRAKQCLPPSASA